MAVHTNIITGEFSYRDMIDKIINREKFDWARVGDGECNAIFQDTRSRANCDGHPYYPDMGLRLRQILESSPSYFIGLQAMAYRQRQSQIDGLTKKYNLTWYPSNLLHHASIKGELQMFFDALNTRDVLVVGPKHLKKLYPAHLENPYFVQVADRNCWLEYDRIRDDIKALIEVKEWCVLYCASMVSNILIDDFQGKATQIDCGSVFDFYCGIKSRSYMYNLNIEQ